MTSHLVLSLRTAAAKPTQPSTFRVMTTVSGPGDDIEPVPASQLIQCLRPRNDAKCIGFSPPLESLVYVVVRSCTLHHTMMYKLTFEAYIQQRHNTGLGFIVTCSVFCPFWRLHSANPVAKPELGRGPPLGLKLEAGGRTADPRPSINSNKSLRGGFLHTV